MVVLDSLLTLTCCCSRFSSCRRLFSSYRQDSRTSSSSKATDRWATMVNLGHRATPTTSKVGEGVHGVLLVEAEVGQGHPFQRTKHPLEQRRELRKGSRC